MKVLVACESSGIVRDAFRALGHDAMSCDLLPCDVTGPHYQGDVRDILGDGWDLLIAHPPCTYLCSSGMHWTTRGLRDAQLTEDALAFVRLLMDAPIARIAIENPVGAISTRIRPADQYIQPYQFGDDASKKTGLWLKGLPHLRQTCAVAPRIVNGRPRWSNQTDNGQNKLPPSADRWKALAGYWHAMGPHNIRSFIRMADPDYLAGKMIPPDTTKRRIAYLRRIVSAFQTAIRSLP